MKNKIIIIFIILLAILFSFIFLLTYSSSGETTLLEKTEKEIEYLEAKVIEIMNSLNNITLSNSILVEEKTEKSSENTRRK